MPLEQEKKKLKELKSRHPGQDWQNNNSVWNICDVQISVERILASSLKSTIQKQYNLHKVISNSWNGSIKQRH